MKCYLNDAPTCGAAVKKLKPVLAGLTITIICSAFAIIGSAIAGAEPKLAGALQPPIQLSKPQVGSAAKYLSISNLGFPVAA